MVQKMYVVLSLYIQVRTIVAGSRPSINWQGRLGVGSRRGLQNHEGANDSLPEYTKPGRSIDAVTTAARQIEGESDRVYAILFDIYVQKTPKSF